MDKQRMLHDVQMALHAHLDWKLKLADFFYGIENVDASKVGDHTQCHFGQWFYGQGFGFLVLFPEFEELEKVHIEVHQSIKDLVVMPQEQRHAAQGRQLLAHFLERCDRFVQLLKDIEQQVQEKLE